MTLIMGCYSIRPSVLKKSDKVFESLQPGTLMALTSILYSMHKICLKYIQDEDSSRNQHILNYLLKMPCLGGSILHLTRVTFTS